MKQFFDYFEYLSMFETWSTQFSESILTEFDVDDIFSYCWWLLLPPFLKNPLIGFVGLEDERRGSVEKNDEWLPFDEAPAFWLIILL